MENQLVFVAIVLMPTALLIAGLIMLALFGRLAMRNAAILAGAIFGASQGYLLWGTGLLSGAWSALIGVVFMLGMSTLLFLFIRKGRVG